MLDNNFICMYLHESIQIYGVKWHSGEWLSDVHIQPLEILDYMYSQIKTNTALNKIRNETSGALTSK